MKKNYLLLTTIITLTFLGTSCNPFEESVPEPFLRVYQVSSSNSQLRPVTVEDFRDGTGIVAGNLLFENSTDEFDAIMDYVDEDRTTFSLTQRGIQSPSFVSGSGTFTSDSIFITINKDGGISISETFVGGR